MTDNIKQFPKASKPALPEAIQHTDSYQLVKILYTDEPMTEVTDFMTGNKRNRRWGMTISFAVVPEYDKVPVNEAPTLLPDTPVRFITADSLDELKARAMYEIDKALTMAKLAVDNPEEFARQVTSTLNS